ncbi:hypothetical protein CI109_100792 [Kwoniella shandongensis]|uniref:Meiotic nuclear division protein 1 n=1 Tax=Kwoniella shandongensis TaxID=1734106 RepID=A0A5M6C099_9TREE|nr:uncharacterized protein CI109_005029 [Kwoniella shandongensis]KAA5526639.1 hypothetical protein CI109_005029 [Kwoniella shandongensis]
MSKRGLSMEEKKTKMLEIFHDTAEFYSLKELEKIAPMVQSVKDVLDDLVGDSLVIMDKIGTGNYFWSLPSAAGATKHAILAKTTKELEGINSKIEETTAALEAAQRGREDTAERRKLLAQLDELNTTSLSLKAELAAFGAADPVRYEKKKEAIKVCKDAAVRWTDNTLIVLQYASGLGAEDAQMRGMLGIGEDWDDLKV